jgi:hypothetical protein
MADQKLICGPMVNDLSAAQDGEFGNIPLRAGADRQAPVTQAIGACIVQISRGTRYQARPDHRNAADAYGCNDRSDHYCYGLAAA